MFYSLFDVILTSIKSIVFGLADIICTAFIYQKHVASDKNIDTKNYKLHNLK